MIHHLIVFVSRYSIEISFEKLFFYFLAVHLGSISKLVMVLGGLYGRLSDVPDSIPYASIKIYW